MTYLDLDPCCAQDTVLIDRTLLGPCWGRGDSLPRFGRALERATKLTVLIVAPGHGCIDGVAPDQWAQALELYYREVTRG
jgi:hypothetical protein